VEYKKTTKREQTMDKIQGPWTARKTLVFFAGTAGGFDLRACPHAEEKARLAAAAPDLLEALKYAVDINTPGCTDGPTYHHVDIFLSRARAAILKATGGAS
jgi:hypothetical protein